VTTAKKAPAKKAPAKKAPAKKAPATPKPSPRTYTGYDGAARATTPGLRFLVDTIQYLTAGRLWDNGTWGIRDIRGKPGAPSIHATGRAVDLSWRNMRDGRRGGGSYADAVAVMEWLVRHEEALGVELVLDYYPRPFGRAWRCDREAWRNYATRTIALAPGGDWFHLEISPAVANDLPRMQSAIAAALR
jgi:hypothetical protein